MFEKISFPPSFSLVQRGKAFLLLHEKYKDLHLEDGIEEVETFLQRHSQTSKYLRGRTLHPSIPIKNGERLKKGVEEIEELKKEAGNLMAKDYHYLKKCHNARNTVELWEILAKTALLRTETRGDHYREDYPMMDNDEWLKWLVVSYAEGEIPLPSVKNMYVYNLPDPAKPSLDQAGWFYLGLVIFHQ
jgi:succinate dehydrogenase/fumarate reductase flavoprotein subunit